MTRPAAAPTPGHDFEPMSHELRTPLTSVFGYSATLLDRWTSMSEEDRLAFVRIIHGEAARMIRAVEEVERRFLAGFAVGSSRSEPFKGLVVLADAS